MRLLALAAAALALLAWLRRRDRPDPYWGLAEQQLEEDGVQPPDPVTFRYVPGYTMPLSPTSNTYPLPDPTSRIVVGPWVNTTTAPDIGDTLEPLTAADRDWLDQTVRSTQAQLMGPFPWRDPFRRSTQTGPLGPTA